MKIFSVGFFNNFAANSYSIHFDDILLEEKSILNLGQLSELSIFDYKSFQKICIFGANHVNSANKQIFYVDFPNSLNKSIDLEIFLDSWESTSDILYERFKNTNNLYIITSDFFSCLEDPRPLLLGLKKIGLELDLHLLYIENGYTGCRVWTQESIKELFRSSGFDFKLIEEGMYAITFSHLSYKDYIEKLGLNTDLIKSHLLLMTTEDATIKPTGGIGTYVKNLKSINPNIVVLICDELLDTSYSRDNTIVVKSLIENIEYDNLINGIGLIEAVKSLLFLLPNIKIIEFQDYQALGFRIVQARETGILPRNLWLRVFMHGGTDHLKYGFQNQDSMNYSFSELSNCVKESYVASHVDQCFSPSKYLGETILQQEFGYQLNNFDIRKLPFDLELIGEVPPTAISKITQIVYIGKYNELKGWAHFIESIKLMSTNDTLLGINSIISLAPEEPIKEDFEFLNTISHYQAMHLKHTELIEFVKKEKNHTLFVIPSRGESYSFIVLEQLLLGAFFIAYNAGGVIEVVDDLNYVNYFLSDPNPSSLAAKITTLLSGKFETISHTIQNFSTKVHQRQVAINYQWLEETNRVYQRQRYLIDYSQAVKDISIVIPVYNTPLEYIQDLVISIKSSKVIPVEVLFINDGSKSDYLNELYKYLSCACDTLNYRIISQKNKGLAGARNCGLREVKTPYAFFIDSDDLLYPTTLQNAWISMQLDKDLVCATGFGIYFVTYNKALYNLDAIRYGDFWKPIGIPDAKALSLYENQFQLASTMVNVKSLLVMGGWDESDRATWEDWALYTKLAWHGKKFSLIPWTGYLYRNTPGSMSKTYNEYFGRRRLIRNIEVFSRLDANIIISLMNNSKESFKKNELLKNELFKNDLWIKDLEKEISRLEELASQYWSQSQNLTNSISWKITKPLRMLSKFIRRQK